MSPAAPPDPLAADLEGILARLEPRWEQLRNASLFITGGSGFFGRWLLASLLLANRRFDLQLKIGVLTRDAQAFRSKAPELAADPALTVYPGDVINFDFPAAHYSHLIHAATTSAHETFHGEDPLRKFDTLVIGTRRVLDFAAQSGTRNVLFTSSGVAYGPPREGTPLNEDFNGAPDTLDPQSALGQAKRAAEFLCATYGAKHGWNTTLARCFSFVGPLMPLDLHYAIGDFIRQAAEGKTIIVKGDGTAIRSYLYAADLVVWLLTMLLREGSPRLYNTGSDQALSIRELATQVRDILCPAAAIQVLGNTAYSIGNPVRNRYVPDLQRTRSELGLEVWTPLSEAIKRTAAYAAPARGTA
jgi:nucleoside-diphosphate-sugar epimerase